MSKQAEREIEDRDAVIARQCAELARLHDVLSDIQELAAGDLEDLGSIPGSNVFQIEADARAALALSGITREAPQ